MTKMLKKAVALVERLPETDEEIIGSLMLSHVEKLRSMRGEFDAGALGFVAILNETVWTSECLEGRRASVW